MPTAWRIVKAAYAAQAFDGEGASLNPGRWNSPGVRMVYTADSPALATLEVLVQLDTTTILPRFVLIAATFPEAIVTRLDPRSLPPAWNAYPALPALQVLGDRWIAAATSCVLQVPSAVIPHHHDFLINPRHPDFSSVAISAPQPYNLNQRLLRKT